MPPHILYSYPQIESLNKQTNANITAICQNSTVCKECKSINTSLTPNIMIFYHTAENLSELIMQKVSTFYHILTFLGNYCNSGKLLFSNSNMYTCNIGIVKAINATFIEIKDAKHYSK